MRVARLLLRSFAKPRVCLERDGAFYDVEALERALGAVVDPGGAPADFHARVVSLGGAGLAELDRALLGGRRPAEARVDLARAARLAPCDTDRASLLRVSPAGVLLGAGLARTLGGDDALIDLGPGAPAADVELGLAVMVGDDVSRDAAPAAIDAAVLGYALTLDWVARAGAAQEAGAPRPGLRVQLGPELLIGVSRRILLAAPLTLRVGARAHALGSFGALGVDVLRALTGVAREVGLAAGDVIAIGPVASAAGLGLAPELHEPVALKLEALGALAGTAVPMASLAAPG